LSTLWGRILTRKKHPNKEIESAIQFAEENDWTIKPPGKNETR
jgi:hypothetical protein